VLLTSVKTCPELTAEHTETAEISEISRMGEPDAIYRLWALMELPEKE
jgi:hypothetical protein